MSLGVIPNEAPFRPLLNGQSGRQALLISSASRTVFFYGFHLCNESRGHLLWSFIPCDVHDFVHFVSALSDCFCLRIQYNIFYPEILTKFFDFCVVFLWKYLHMVNFESVMYNNLAGSSVTSGCKSMRCTYAD